MQERSLETSARAGQDPVSEFANLRPGRGLSRVGLGRSFAKAKRAIFNLRLEQLLNSYLTALAERPLVSCLLCLKMIQEEISKVSASVRDVRSVFAVGVSVLASFIKYDYNLSAL